MRFELDSASTMFVLGRNEMRSYMIQFSIRLHEPIDETILQSALEATVKKYPFFFARFVHGFSRLYAEPAGYTPKVFRAGSNPYRQLYEAQVRFSGSTILLEYSHFITDGRGGLQFLLHLTAEYLSRKHSGENFLQGIPVPSTQEQSQNGYRTFGEGIRGAGRRGGAYQIKGTPLGCAVAPKRTTYRLSVSEIQRLAKGQQATVTEYMSALLCTAIWRIMKEHASGTHSAKIRLSVPVDLRPRFSCHTMRNFSLNVFPEVNPAKDDMTLSELCGKFHRYMGDATEQKKLAGRCGLIERVGNGALVKALPFSLKRKLVQTALDTPFGKSTLTFSNLGIVRLPEGMEAHVETLEMTFSPKPETPYSCSLISLKDTMNLSFLRTIKLPILEKELEQLFTQFHISYKKVVIDANKEVETNG